ncbi:MAG: porin family protein [candidate division Zixibacteria bacterium]|nr:porin family protein [candidate division Zixibacteria bacterium]
MRRLLLAVVLVSLFTVGVSAQQTIPGVTGKGFKLGFDIANINTDYDELDEFLDSRVAFIGGAYMTYSFDRHFAVQPEIFYVMKGAEKDLFFITAHWSSDYLEVPVLLKYDFMPDGPVHPNLFVGPALDVLLSSKFKISDYEVDVSDGMKTIDFSLVFGGGLDYKRFVFDVRYTLGLVNTVDAEKVNELTGALPDDSYYLEGDPSIKNTNISFMVGVKF